MARTGDRGGSLTRARIAEIANRLFLERGFDDVTVAEVAAAAEVSKVTVFSHFPRKEDLLLDRVPDTFDQLRAAFRDRTPGTGAPRVLRELAFALLDAGDPVSSVDERGVPLLRTVARSPALLARARELCEELEHALAAELRRDPAFDGDPDLVAALLIATWRSVYVASVRRLLDGAPGTEIAAEHRRRLTAAFDTLAEGIDTAAR